jgi:hypothetical protein
MDESGDLRDTGPVARRFGAPRPSRERKRPSVCGFRPLPLASPGKGRSFRQPTPPPRSRHARGAADHQAARPDLHPNNRPSRTCVRDGPSLELQQPVRSSDRIARLDASRRPRHRSSLPLRFRFDRPSRPCDLELGCGSPSASRRSLEPEGPSSRREKQAVRLGFGRTLTRPSGLAIAPAKRPVLEPVHNSWETGVTGAEGAGNPRRSRLSTANRRQG